MDEFPLGLYLWLFASTLTVMCIIVLMCIKGINDTISTFLFVYFFVWAVVIPFCWYLYIMYIPKKCSAQCFACNTVYNFKKNPKGISHVKCPNCGVEGDIDATTRAN